MTAEIVPFGLQRPIAEELIHRLARDGKFGMDADSDFDNKMLLRGFTMRQVLETIKEGSVNQDAWRD
jgi:hypothetical protein